MRKAWTTDEENFIKKNIHLDNQELAIRLDRTLASVENKVRELGLARIFQKEEIEILRKVWGRKRKSIENALPRFTWRQISKKANNIGLPPLKDMREAANLYSIIESMGIGDSFSKKWQEAGLRITNDKGKNMKNNILLVDIDEFWDFAMKHPDIVDLTKIGDNTEAVLGIPPPELIEMKKTAKPIETRVKHTVLKGQRRKELANLFYTTSIPTKRLMSQFDVSEDTVRHVASEYKQPGQKRNTTTVVTERFLRRLYKLYYVECKTRAECKEILKCSASSIDRGIKKLATPSKKNTE